MSLDWYRVKEFAPSKDLSELAAWLQRSGLPHRISEIDGVQVLLVPEEKLIQPLQEMLHKLEHGELLLPELPEPALVKPEGPSLLAQALRAPVTLVMIALGILGALLLEFDAQARILGWLTFTPVEIRGDYLLIYGADELAASGQYWRLLTPIFLHFGLFHILFNSLWVWELARRYEFLYGSRALIIFTLLLGVFSNAAQYLSIIIFEDKLSLFGGLSGVIYGYIGYIWMRQKFAPNPLLAINPSVIIFMLLWLALCLTGFIDFFISGSVANAAHLSGLLAGVACGLYSSFLGAGRSSRQP